MKNFMFCLYALIVILGGCAHVMSEAGLAGVDSSITYADIKKNPDSLTGKVVIVGGVIAETRSSGDVMQMEIAQLELLENGVPYDGSPSQGRFLVVSGELLDPLFYRPGSLVTVIGEIKGQRTQKLESTDYRYPVISAREIRLFPATETLPERSNPYQNLVGDEKFMRRPPGLLDGEPHKQ